MLFGTVRYFLKKGVLDEYVREIWHMNLPRLLVKQRTSPSTSPTLFRCVRVLHEETDTRLKTVYERHLSELNHKESSAWQKLLRRLSSSADRLQKSSEQSSDFETSDVPILVVDSADTGTEFVEALNSDCPFKKYRTVIGMDTESFPRPVPLFMRQCSRHHRLGRSEQRALIPVPDDLQWLQVATPKAVFLIDLPALKRQPAVRKVVSDSLASVLTDPLVLKVGFAFDGDMHELASVLPCFAVGTPIPSLAELMPLSEVLPGTLDDGTKVRGLSKVAMHVLGRRLDKHCQVSNWSRRPLRDDQKMYAALDALAPVKVAMQLEQRREHLAALLAASDKTLPTLGSMTSDVVVVMKEKKSKKKNASDNESSHSAQNKRTKQSNHDAEPEDWTSQKRRRTRAPVPGC
ncbi:MAG: hypothetical protein MHM6MM_003636 [Cercozoa sp. M6MM]